MQVSQWQMKCFKGEMQLYASRKGLHQQHEPVRWICLKYIWFFSVRSRAKPSYRMPQHIRSFPTGIRSLPAGSFTWQQHWCWPNWSAFQSASTFPSSSSTASPRKVNYFTTNGNVLEIFYSTNVNKNVDLTSAINWEYLENTEWLFSIYVVKFFPETNILSGEDILLE